MLPDNLPHRCAVYESYHLGDEIGADRDDAEQTTTNLPCWVQPASDREISQFLRRDQVVTHTIYFRGNPGLRPGFTIIPSNGPFSGARLEVRSANETTAGLGVLWKATCEEIQPR